MSERKVSSTHGKMFKRYLDKVQQALTVKNEQATKSRNEVHRLRPRLNLLLYAALVTHSMIYDEFLPIFMYAKRHQTKTVSTAYTLALAGGLGMEKSDVGIYFLVCGVFAVIVQLTVFPVISRSLGPLQSMKLCAIMLPLIYTTVPFTVLLEPSTKASTALLMVIMLSKSFFTTIAFPCSMVLLSGSVSNNSLGTLNGLASGSSGVARAVGAMVFGFLFTKGFQRECIIVPWWCLALLAILGALPIFWLKDTIAV